MLSRRVARRRAKKGEEEEGGGGREGGKASRASPSVMQISVWPVITGVFAGATAIATATRSDLQPPY